MPVICRVCTGITKRYLGRVLLPPEYHGDWIRGARRVLCFRNYGGDIVSRLLAAGFRSARIEPVDGSAWWHIARPVLVAEK